MAFDYTLAGKRVELIHTDDPYTRLSSGDKGTIKYSFPNLNENCIVIKWDSGSNLSLIEGKDTFRILEKEEKENE